MVKMGWKQVEDKIRKDLRNYRSRKVRVVGYAICPGLHVYFRDEDENDVLESIEKTRNRAERIRKLYSLYLYFRDFYSDYSKFEEYARAYTKSKFLEEYANLAGEDITDQEEDLIELIKYIYEEEDLLPEDAARQIERRWYGLGKIFKYPVMEDDS